MSGKRGSHSDLEYYFPSCLHHIQHGLFIEIFFTLDFQRRDGLFYSCSDKDSFFGRFDGFFFSLFAHHHF